MNKFKDIFVNVILPKLQLTDILSFEQKTTRIYTKVKKNVIVVDIGNFLKMIMNSKQFNVGNEAIKHHIILHGAESYYQLLEKAEY